MFCTKAIEEILKTIFTIIQFFFAQEAFKALILDSMSTIFIPPLHIGPIKVFRFILSLLFHRNSKIFAFDNLIVFSSGYSKIEAT